MNANCALCGCYNNVVSLSNGVMVCADDLPCARRIRQDRIYQILNPFVDHWRAGFGKTIGVRFRGQGYIHPEVEK